MFRAQGGLCAICRSSRPTHGQERALQVDHCHASGRIRGLLCRDCNMTLGVMKDDVLRIRALADYLERYR